MIQARSPTNTLVFFVKPDPLTVISVPYKLLESPIGFTLVIFNVRVA